MKFLDILSRAINLVSNKRSINIEHSGEHLSSYYLRIDNFNDNDENKFRITDTKTNTVYCIGTKEECLNKMYSLITNNVQIPYSSIHDTSKTQEEIIINRKKIADDIVSVNNNVFLPVEFKIRRWNDETSWLNNCEPYLTTRDGGLLPTAVLTNVGGTIIWKGVRGDSLTNRLLNNTDAVVVVSNVTGSPAATDTTVADEIGRKNMDTSFPLIPGETAGGVTAGNRAFILRGTFGSSDANGDWRRFWVVNSLTPTEEVFDNFSSSQGTKVSGQVWELTVTLTIT